MQQRETHSQLHLLAAGKRLQLRLLGDFELRHGIRPPQPLPKKARALLAYLAMHPGRSILREQLATLLWGNSRTEQARRSLRECLMAVRAALGPTASALGAEGMAVRLDPEQVEIDVRRFEALSRSTTVGDLQAASELYRDEFLCDVQVASEPFAEWTSLERRRLSAIMSDVLHRLATARAESGNGETAIEAARRLTEFDSLREDGHRLLIRLLAEAGRRNAALKQYALCADLLRRELGVAPERDTADLAEAIRRGRTSGSHFSDGKISEAPAIVAPVLPPGISNKISIAVFPFSNLSNDAGQDYFADGIAEELTTTLGRVPWLFVIGSSAATPYRKDKVDIRGAGSELGVRYILRGSVRRNDKRVRIVAQLLDAAKGGQLWAERFDGEMEDIFAIQDQVAAQASAKIAPALQSIEIERSQRKPTKNLNAYDLYLRALPRFRTTFEENKEALHLLTRAITIDPLYGSAYGLAARCYQFQRLFGWVIASDPRLQEGVRLAHLAAEIGRNDSEALWMAGIAVAQLAGEMECGLALIERSLSLNPNSASAWISSSFVRGEIGDADAALADFHRAQHLNPLDSIHHVQRLAAGFAHMAAGRYQEAASAIDKTLEARPSYTPAMRLKISVCGLLEQKEDASKWVRRLLAVNPDASVSWLHVFWQLPLRHNPGLLGKLLEGARLAGLPEGEQTSG